jgi:outer membrane protein OmpA-like peptidoglycan-associated protein
MRKFARSSPNNTDGMDFSISSMHVRDSEEKSSAPRRMLIPGIGALMLLAVIACAGYFFWSQWSQNIRSIPRTPATGAAPSSINASASSNGTEQKIPAPQTLAKTTTVATTRPQAAPPVSTAADTPASAATHPAAPPATPATDSPDNTAGQEEVTAAIVTISPTTGLATIRPAAGAMEQKQTAETSSSPAPAAVPPAAAANGGQEAASNGGKIIIAPQHQTDISTQASPAAKTDADEIIIDPRQKKTPAQAPPAVEAEKTPERNDTPPPASNKPLPHLKAILPLRAGSLLLTGEGNVLLANFVDKFKKAGHGKIEVRGYVSSTNDSKGNTRLSLRRAEAVRTMLIHAGIKEASIVVRGMGIQHPLASNDTEEGREKNRRVELEVIP